MSELALLGGPKMLNVSLPDELFHWPIITKEDEDAVLDVLHRNAMSGTDITEQFQNEFAAWQERRYCLAYCNGTMALQAAMFAVGLGAGDELICPTKTYWASCTAAQTMGASVVFANIDETLCIDPDDLERCISPRTRAIMVVHYFAHPADMDRIMEIADRHGIPVIEDVSHAQGGYYKGKKLGTFGVIAAMSLMSGKSFAAGELGALVCDDTKLYERALAFAHYERFNERYITESDDLKPYCHIPLAGIKGRANQMSTAMARVQLKYYDERTKEIRRAMNYFWDRLDGLPGIRPLRVDESDGSTMAGWYCPHGIYKKEELGGLPVSRFTEAVRAETDNHCWAGGNFCLHTHPVFRDYDYFHLGRPSRIAFSDRDVRDLDAACDRSLSIDCFSIPWFKRLLPEYIDLYADAYKKVIANYRELLDGSEGISDGRWYGKENR